MGGLLLLAGVSLLGARFGFAVPVQVVLPVLVVLGGALLAYAQLDEVERSRWASITGSGTRAAVLRGAAGLALVLVGVVFVVVQGDLGLGRAGPGRGAGGTGRRRPGARTVGPAAVA